MQMTLLQVCAPCNTFRLGKLSRDEGLFLNLASEIENQYLCFGALSPNNAVDGFKRVYSNIKKQPYQLFNRPNTLAYRLSFYHFSCCSQGVSLGSEF